MCVLSRILLYIFEFINIFSLEKGKEAKKHGCYFFLYFYCHQETHQPHPSSQSNIFSSLLHLSLPSLTLFLFFFSSFCFLFSPLLYLQHFSLSLSLSLRVSFSLQLLLYQFHEKFSLKHPHNMNHIKNPFEFFFNPRNTSSL